jgi:hypothetical protein
MMTIQIDLKPDEERALRERARMRGQDAVQYARQVIRDHIRDGNLPGAVASEATTFDDLIDDEAVAACAREIEGEDVPSIEEVRQALSKIHESMATAVIEEREDRF